MEVAGREQQGAWSATMVFVIVTDMKAGRVSTTVVPSSPSNSILLFLC